MNTYSPLELGNKIKEIVVQGEKRKYYRFRDSEFYGGIATADCVGCNLSCYFCWSNKPRKNPEKSGKFYSPAEVSEKLTSIAEEKNFHRVRISGNEPTLERKHLLKVIERIEGSGLNFILETNGILVGEDRSYARELAKFNNLHVRVSLKGCDPNQFSELTGADPSGFELQLQCLRNLSEAEGDFHASVMGEFSSQKQFINLRKKLAEIEPSLARNLELEALKLYPHVKKQLKEQDLI